MSNAQRIAEWIAALDSPNWFERDEAKTALIMEGSDAVEALVEALQSEIGRRCYEAADILAQIDDERWIAPMQHALNASNILLAEGAVRALERYSRAVLEAYIDALPRSHHFVQLRIVAALERLEDRRAVVPLMKLLQTAPSPSLRCAIIQAIGTLGDPEAIILIRSFKNDEDHHVRKRVQAALQCLGDSTLSSNQEGGAPCC